MTSSRRTEDVDEALELDDLEEIVAPPPPSSRSLVIATRPVHSAPPPLPRPPAGSAPFLEKNATSRSSFANLVAASPARSRADIVADSLAANPAMWIEQLWRSADDERFAERAPLVEPAVRILGERGETSCLWPIACALYRAASDGGDRRAMTRAGTANAILRVFGDPKLLASVAQHVLNDSAPSEEAKRLLVQAGVAGAHALYTARLRATPRPEVRTAFPRALSAFGTKAWPVIEAALDKLHKTIRDPRARELAEELLLAAPASVAPANQNAAGQLFGRFVRVDSVPVAKAGALALARVWGERAQPVLLGLLDGKDDAGRIAALAALRQTGQIDEHVVPRLSGFLLQRVPAQKDVRVGAAFALADVTAPARAVAIHALEQAVLAPVAPGRVDAGQDDVVLAAAHTLVQLRAPDAGEVLAERARRSGPALRAKLEQMLFRR